MIFDNVLPHILLSRGTLPWEQSGGAGDSGLPWLALLLFDEDDGIEAQVSTLAEITRFSEFKDLSPLVGQRPDDRVVVLGVPRGRLTQLMPTAAELSLLTHVRQKAVDGKPTGAEMAAVICGRLPEAGRTSTVHLVSVAGRFTDGSFDTSTSTGDLVRLLSLKSWRFACVADGPDFVATGQRLDRGTVALPVRGKPSVDAHLSHGYVPFPHHLRQAERTVPGTAGHSARSRSPSWPRTTYFPCGRRMPCCGSTSRRP